MDAKLVQIAILLGARLVSNYSEANSFHAFGVSFLQDSRPESRAKHCMMASKRAELNSLVQEASVPHHPTNEKVQLLTQVFEFFEKDAALFNEFYAAVLPFVNNASFEIRELVISEITKISLGNISQYVSFCLPILLRGVSDENLSVVKRSITCTSKIFRSALFVVATHNSVESIALLDILNKIKLLIIMKLSTPRPSGVTISILKFLEVLVLSFSFVQSDGSASTENTNATAKFTLDALLTMDATLRDTKKLTIGDLKQEGESYAAMLTNFVCGNNLRPMNPTEQIACVSCLMAVVRQRSQFMQQIASSLVIASKQFQQLHPSSTQLASIQYSFKAALISILKIRTMDVALISEGIVESLILLGAKEQAQQLYSRLMSATNSIPNPNLFSSTQSESAHKRPHSQVEDGPSSFQSSKKQKEDAVPQGLLPLPASGNPGVVAPSPAHNILQTQAGPISLARCPVIIDQLFHAQFTFEMMIDLALESMASLPTVPPSAISQSGLTIPAQPVPIIAAQGNPPLVPPKVDPRRDPRRPKSEGGIDDILPDVALAAPTIVPSISREKEAEVNLSKPPPSLKIVTKNEDHFENSFSRLITDWEAIAQTTGKSGHRNSIIAKLAIRYLHTKNKLEELLIGHISSHFSTRKDLCVSWLFEAYVHDSITSEQNYDKLFLVLVRALGSSLDPKDKLLGHIFLEAPYIPSEAFGILDRYATDPKSITMGLSTLRELVLFKPKYTNKCLDMLLNYASNSNETIRSPAIRLVTNKLFDMQISPISQHIEQFASNSLMELIDKSAPVDEGSDHLMEEDFNQPKGTKSENEEEVKRHLLLFFALCTKKFELLERIFELYTQTTQFVKRVIHQQSVGLVRTIAVSMVNHNAPISQPIIQLLTSFPKGSESLMLHFLNILTESGKPHPQLVGIVRNLFQKRVPDARFLIPILPGLDKEEITKNLPKLVNVPSNMLKSMVQKALNFTPSITPSEFMVALHLVDSKDQTSLKKAIEAIQLCFDQQSIFKQEVLAVVLQQLIDVNPIPPLLMRTMIQTVSRHPKLVSFVITLLTRLVAKQVWTDKRIWEGFVKCCKLTQPHSFPVLISLPPSLLESALSSNPELKDPLELYCKANGVKIPWQQ